MATAHVESLRAIPLFSGLSKRSLGSLAKAMKEVEFPAGQVLTQPGTKGTGMFFIADGTAAVATRRVRRELGPGEFFGELALISQDATRTARVRAVTDLRCLALDRTSFRKLVREHPEVAAALLEVALNRLAENAGVPGTA